MPARERWGDAGLLTAAVMDNAAWCELVARVHGVPTSRRPDLWWADGPMPPFFPGAVTLERGAHLGSRRHRGAVKDSFADLDPGPGFSVLFAAEWIGLPEDAAASPGPGSPAVRVVPPVDAARWAAAHGHPDLDWTRIAADPGVRLLDIDVDVDGGHLGGGLPVSAALTLGTAPDGPAVVGLGNVVVHDTEPVAAWRAVIAGVRAVSGGRAIVGYERDADLAAAVEAGFRRLGPLRIWSPDG